MQNFEEESKALAKNSCFVKVEKGQQIAKRKGCIIVLKWKGKRDVMMLTTCHSAKMIPVSRRGRQREEKKKPESVYNNYMCGVDRMDQLMSYYSPLRKTLKWY